MSTIIKVLTPKQAVFEEQRRIAALTVPCTETDRTTYEKCLGLYRQLCMDVRSLLNLPTFRGGFDEWVQLAMDDSLSDNRQLDILARRGSSLNELITYEAKKLGIVPPDWWKECWADELNAQSEI